MFFALEHQSVSLPPLPIGPPRRAALTLGDVRRMPRLEAGALGLHPIRFAFLGFAGGLGALLPKAFDLLLPIVARLHDVRLGGVAWRAARLVASHRLFIHALAHFLRAARMLSTILG